jgi:hypothetical protein
MGEEGAEAGGAPAVKWVLLAGRILLAIGFITIFATDGTFTLPLAVAGVLAVFLAGRWVVSGAAWDRDYAWMGGLSTAEATLYIGYTVGRDKPVLPLSAAARRAIGVATMLVIGAGLLLIGIGVQAGWL